MVLLGPGGQYIPVEKAILSSSSSEDVVVQAKNIVSCMFHCQFFNADQEGVKIKSIIQLNYFWQVLDPLKFEWFKTSKAINSYYFSEAHFSTVGN